MCLNASRDSSTGSAALGKPDAINDDLRGVKTGLNEIFEDDRAEVGFERPDFALLALGGPATDILAKQTSVLNDAIAASPGVRQLQENMSSIASTMMQNSQIARSMERVAEMQSKLYASQFTADILRASEIARSFNAMVSPELFEKIRRAVVSLTYELSPDVSSLLRVATEKARQAFDSVEYLYILDASQWPLHLSQGEELTKEILALSPDDERLSEKVAEIAEAHLGNDWVEEVRSRWFSDDDLSEGEMAVLNVALQHHCKGEYHASVAILMCMLEGLAEKYVGDIKRLEGDKVELFNLEAGKHKLNPLPQDGKRAYGFKAKDQLVIMMLHAERGFYVWKSAYSYLIDVVLTNGGMEEVCEHNPLRNKICHGVQTNFGTKEHSLKSILAIDLLIRLGRVIALCDGEFGEGSA